MEAPERIWIAPVHGATRPDDFYLIDPEYRNGRGVEYIRADLLAAHIGAVLEEAMKACERAAYDGQYPHDDLIELGCLRSRDYIKATRPDALQALDRVRRKAEDRIVRRIIYEVVEAYEHAAEKRGDTDRARMARGICAAIRALIEAERGKP